MPSVLEVLRITHVPDGMGGTIEQETVTAITRCRLAPAGSTSSTSVMAGKLDAEVKADVLCPVTTDVNEADRIMVDGAGYEVVAIVERSAEHSAHTELLCQRR